jgi:hypothetical protein
MPGFDNDTMFCANVDFRGIPYPIQPQVISDGQLLIGAAVSPNIRVNTLTAGTGVSIVNGPGNITLNATGVGLTWIVAVSDTGMQVNHGYGSNGSVNLNFTLPAVAKVGDSVSIVQMNGNKVWTIHLAPGQKVFSASQSWDGNFGDTITCTSAAPNTHDGVTLVCLIANSEWYAISQIGNIN